MIVGFSGTRRAVSQMQRDWLAQRLLLLQASELHHGDCVGADAMAHELAQRIGIRVVIHPPANPRYRAWCKPLKGDVLLVEAPYLVRNKMIVLASEVLLALPNGPEVQRGSGTWSTIRFAREHDHEALICLPDGPLYEEG